jgi:hypothetical protein
MKKTLLSAFAILALAFGSNAQISGIRVFPEGASGDDEITIEVTTNLTCPLEANDQAKSMATATVVRIHGGVKINNQIWQLVVDAGPASTEFTQSSPGVWTKTLTPRTYWNVPAGTDIDSLCFVVNGGPTVANMWDKEGKVNGPDGCTDFFVPMPVPQEWAALSTKPKNSLVLASKVYPNPTNGQVAISFNSKASFEGSVKISNILGQTVETVFSGMVKPGQNTFKWDASKVSEGVYFYTVEGEGVLHTKKINVIK